MFQLISVQVAHHSLMVQEIPCLAQVGHADYVDAIDDRTFEAFLSKSTDTEARGFVISLLGWKRRSGSMDYLKSLVAAGGKQSQYATLSVVAIEQRIAFPGRDFASEFYRSYAAKALHLAKKGGISLRESAQQVAESLRAENAFD